jgi:hypothetical protein
MNKNKILLWLIMLLVAGFAAPEAFSQQPQSETITITTYYPAPYGVYNNLRLYPISITNAPECNSTQEGAMYYDKDRNEILICGPTPADNDKYEWRPIGFWTMEGNQLYPHDTDWNVAIGRKTPNAKLDVAGGVKIAFDTSVCNRDKAGTLRYHPNLASIQYCDGVEWRSLPTGWGFGGAFNTGESTSGVGYGQPSVDGWNCEEPNFLVNPPSCTCPPGFRALQFSLVAERDDMVDLLYVCVR